MDDLDFAILREVSHPQTFQWNVRFSYAQVARAVKADEETARLRLRRLEEQGVIAGWEVAVHPALLGRGLFRADTPPLPEDAREKALAALAATDGARLLFEYYGGAAGLVAYVPPGAELAAWTRAVESAVGRPARVMPLNLPAPSVEPDRTDWRIAHALRRAPRASYADLARDVGVPERTLARRVERLTAGRAFYLNPDVDIGRITGALPCVARVRYRPGARRAPVEAALRALPRIVFVWSEGDDARVSFNAGTLVEVDRLRRELEAVAGGEATVAIDLTLRRATLRAWLDGEIARRAAI